MEGQGVERRREFWVSSTMPGDLVSFFRDTHSHQLFDHSSRTCPCLFKLMYLYFVFCFFQAFFLYLFLIIAASLGDLFTQCM